jgi:flagellar L-ring protein precursor FlgH
MMSVICFLAGTCRKAAVLAAAALLGGCASQAPQGEMPASPDYSQLPVAPRPATGGLFQAGYELSLFSDVKAARVGDIVTVMLVEQNSGQKSSDTNLNQSTAVNVATPVFGGSARPNLGVGIDAGNVYVGESGSRQSNRLNGSIAVTVREVLPSGNLLVEGEKWMQINQGNEFIRLRGVIRPRDVGPNNVIYSTQVADARISYSGNGTTQHASTPGWLSRLLFSPLRLF